MMAAKRSSPLESATPVPLPSSQVVLGQAEVAVGSSTAMHLG
jgi:hypothetical protein